MLNKDELNFIISIIEMDLRTEGHSSSYREQTIELLEKLTEMKYKAYREEFDL